MRRWYLVLVTLCALAVVGGPALAAVTNGPHDAGINAGAQGVCSPCHLPHTGQDAARLWPVAPSTALTPGVTPSLCASCHYATGAYQTVGAFNDARLTSSNVFGTYSHGKKMLRANIPPGENMAAQAAANPPLPYTASGAAIECTSCHNVHDDAQRPFLRSNLDTLCVRCHNAASGTQGRQFTNDAISSGSVAWGRTHLGNGNPGSHPVGTDITEALGDATNLHPITFPAQFTAALSASSTTQSVGNWSLGGHLVGGGVGCVTCHAVHGMARDPQDTVSAAYTSHDTSPNMLVIDQTDSNYGTVAPTNGFSTEATTSNRTIANGHNTVGNTFCEACHNAGASPIVPTGYTGSRLVNPGNTVGTHPVDDYPAVNEAVGALPANLPASSVASGTGQAAICESCHTPHPAAWNPAAPAEGRANIWTGAGAYILRDSQAGICNRCHTSTITRHHPVGRDITTAIGSGRAAAYLVSGITSPSMILSCGTCHANGAGGAHNWGGRAAVSMSSNWRPRDNGRNYTTPQNDRFFTDNNSYSVSTSCVDCHLDLDGAAGATNLSPTMGARTAGALGTDNTEDEYTYLGSGSHYLGPFGDNFLNSNHTVRSSGTTTFNPRTGTWTTAIFGTGNAQGGWSRFGGTSTAPLLVCESCHELQPSLNATQHMLLSNFREGQSETLAYASAYDDFCEACHSKPQGTHPMTTDNVGRTGALLDTTIATATRPWLVTGSPKATPTGGAAGTSTWTTGAPGAGIMTCESCHQVHDANTQSASLIVEAPNANVTGGTVQAITATNYYGGNAIANRLREKAPSFATGNGTMPDVSMFCDQCHGYRR